MSAFVAIVHPTAVHVLTDSAACAPDGTLVAASVKAWPIPHLNAVVAGRGSALGGLAQTAMLIGGIAATFDEMKGALPGYLPEIAEAWDSIGENVDLLIAGVGARGPEAFVVSSVERPGAPVWAVTPVDGMSAAPWDEMLRADFYKQFPRDVTPADLDPERDGCAIMEIMRRRPMHWFDGSAGHFVGVAVTLTTVRDHRIEQRVVRRWPDVVGEKISPNGFSLLSLTRGAAFKIDRGDSRSRIGAL